MLELLLEHYDSIEDMQADYNTVGALRMVEGGCFAISYMYQKQELFEAGHSTVGLSDAEVYELYKSEVVRVLDEEFGGK